MDYGADCLTGWRSHLGSTWNGLRCWKYWWNICALRICLNQRQVMACGSKDICRMVMKLRFFIYVAQSLWRRCLFDDPFGYADEALAQNLKLAKGRSIFVDFHAEATSEKMAMAQYLDGRVSGRCGDAYACANGGLQIFTKGGTAFQCDAGMCGDYDSVIGVKKPMCRFKKFLQKVPLERLIPAPMERRHLRNIDWNEMIQAWRKILHRSVWVVRLNQTLPDF